MKPYSILRVATGMIMLVFGLNQFLNPNYWLAYIPSFISPLIPFDHKVFMQLHASVNILLGIFLILGIWRKLIACVAVIWWVSIVPAALLKQWDVGMRDAVIFCGLITYLLSVLEQSPQKIQPK